MIRLQATTRQSHRRLGTDAMVMSRPSPRQKKPNYTITGGLYFRLYSAIPENYRLPALYRIGFWQEAEG